MSARRVLVLARAGVARDRTEAALRQAGAALPGAWAAMAAMNS